MPQEWATPYHNFLQNHFLVWPTETSLIILNYSYLSTYVSTFTLLLLLSLSLSLSLYIYIYIFLSSQMWCSEYEQICKFDWISAFFLISSYCYIFLHIHKAAVLAMEDHLFFSMKELYIWRRWRFQGWTIDNLGQIIWMTLVEFY
jgi:hypothetical protein